MNHPDKCSYCQGLQREIAACKCSGGSGTVEEPPFEITIEKEIPVPQKRSSYADVLETLEVGDSFLLPTRYHRNNISRPLRDLGKKGWKFTQRTQPDGRLRMWRIA